MRLWHKDLIPYLPRQQLLAQWRECCCIARNWAVNGTPNHLLVNRVKEYDPNHFITYCYHVINEMDRRGYFVSKKSKTQLYSHFGTITDDKDIEIVPINELFQYWHNSRYLKQCLFNLQEKYDCGGITQEEWKIIINKFGELL